MKILLLGATGRTGRHVLHEALEAGHEVTCLSRNTSRINVQEGLTTIEGNTTDPKDLKLALEGCDAAISILNVSRHSDFPWSRLRTPYNFLSETMKELLPLAEKADLKRLVVCSAWGVGDSAGDIPGWFSWFIKNSNIGVAYDDHERQEELIEASPLPWTIVRPVGLTNFSRPEAIRESFQNKPKPSLTISRRSVALYLVQALANDQLVGKKVVISKG